MAGAASVAGLAHVAGDLAVSGKVPPSVAEEMSPIRLLIIIPSLGAGGAERQLCELVRAMDRKRFAIHLAVFYDQGEYDGGELWPELESLPGLRIYPLHKRQGLAGHILPLLRLLMLGRRLRPQVIHGYLSGNLHALLLASLLGVGCVWGIRRTSADPDKLGWRSRLVTRAMVPLSRRVALIIFNSWAGRGNHERLGFRGRRHEVIANGIDVTRFRPDPEAGRMQRARWGIEDSCRLVGIVGRLNPVKDHVTFLRAVALACRNRPDLRAVCIGGGPAETGAALKAEAEALGIADRVIWAGVCTDMVSAYNALDVLVLTSTDEGFPNVIGEAMACGIGCIATRVGDAEDIIGDTGLIAGVGDAPALAKAIGLLLNEEAGDQYRRGVKARERICMRFNAETLGRNTENVLEALIPFLRPALFP